MKASKTLTTSIAAAAMVGVISLAYAQTADEAVGNQTNQSVAQVQPQESVTPVEAQMPQSPQSTDLQSVDTTAPRVAPSSTTTTPGETGQASMQAPTQAPMPVPMATPTDPMAPAQNASPAAASSYERNAAPVLTERSPRPDRN